MGLGRIRVPSQRIVKPKPVLKTRRELGEIMLREHGPEACERGYKTTDPEWVGRYALQYGDIRADGTLN